MAMAAINQAVLDAKGSQPNKLSVPGLLTKPNPSTEPTGEGGNSLNSTPPTDFTFSENPRVRALQEQFLKDPELVAIREDVLAGRAVTEQMGQEADTFLTTGASGTDYLQRLIDRSDRNGDGRIAPVFQGIENPGNPTLDERRADLRSLADFAQEVFGFQAERAFVNGNLDSLDSLFQPLNKQ